MATAFAKYKIFRQIKTCERAVFPKAEISRKNLQTRAIG